MHRPTDNTCKLYIGVVIRIRSSIPTLKTLVFYSSPVCKASGILVENIDNVQVITSRGDPGIGNVGGGGGVLFQNLRPPSRSLGLRINTI